VFLKSIELENVRCFEHIQLDLDEPGGENRKWSVLIGENGVGKSTVLRAIALVLSGSDSLAELLGEPSHWVRHDAKTAIIRAKIETVTGEERTLELEIPRDGGLSSVIAKSIETLAELNAPLEHTSRSYFVAAYGSSRRLATTGLNRNSNMDRFRQPRSRTVASLFDRDVELASIESWAMDLDYRHKGKGLDSVTDILSDFLPELTFLRIDKENRDLIFETPDGATPLQQLSDGYQNVAGWVGDLLYRLNEVFGDHKDPLNARGLLLIDEVDLHLHPKWQRRLLDFLSDRIPRMQIIVTTHSLVTAQQTPEGSLFYLRREDGPVRLHTFAGDPRKLLVNQLLMTEAFGGQSDESLKVEEMKSEYRQLAAKPRPSSQDREKMATIVDAVGQRPLSQHEGAWMNEKQRQILERIERIVEEDSE